MGSEERTCDAALGNREVTNMRRVLCLRRTPREHAQTATHDVRSSAGGQEDSGEACFPYIAGWIRVGSVTRILHPRHADMWSGCSRQGPACTQDMTRCCAYGLSGRVGKAVTPRRLGWQTPKLPRCLAPRMSDPTTLMMPPRRRKPWLCELGILPKPVSLQSIPCDVGFNGPG